MTPPEPLWSDERIAKWVNGLSELASSQMTGAMRRVRDEYEAERAAHLARIVELERELVSRGEAGA